MPLRALFLVRSVVKSSTVKDISMNLIILLYLKEMMNQCKILRI